MKKFRLVGNVITEHEVLSETAKFITYKRNGGAQDREAKKSTSWNWFDTREDAIKYRIKEWQEAINYAELRLRLTKEELENFKINNPF